MTVNKLIFYFESRDREAFAVETLIVPGELNYIFVITRWNFHVFFLSNVCYIS